MVTQVKELKLRSFRGINHLDLKFHPNISVFLGVNGVGKSTILDALSILLSELFILSKASYQQNPPARVHIYRSQLNTFINLANQALPVRKLSSSDVKREYSDCQVSIELIHDDLNVNWSVTKNTDFPVDLSEESWKELGDFVAAMQEDVLSHRKRNIPLFLYLSTNRIVSDIPLDIQSRLNGDLFDVWDGIAGMTHAGFPDFFRWFRVTEDLENESRRDNADYRDVQLEAIRNALPRFLSGFTDLRVRRSPSLRMTVTKGDRELFVDQLSDGEKCLLAMVGDIARRLSIANPGLADPLQGEGVVLIDELDLHLHPKWQRGIIPKLTETFPNCQFIVATHSPQIVSDVHPESVFILKQTESDIIVEHPDYSFGRDSNQILEDLMGVSDRPEQIKMRLQDLFELIENGELEHAKQVKNDLEHLMGLDEPEFAKADVLIRRKEILGR